MRGQSRCDWVEEGDPGSERAGEEVCGSPGKMPIMWQTPLENKYGSTPAQLYRATLGVGPGSTGDGVPILDLDEGI